MSWKVRVSDRAKKQLSKIDPYQRKLLVGWIEKTLEGCDNPRVVGKALEGDLSNLWSYRIGSYRLIADIEDNELVILLVKVGHRRDVYKEK